MEDNDLILDIDGSEGWNAKKQLAFEQLQYIAKQAEEKNIDLTGGFGSDWFLIGCVCAMYDEKGRAVFHQISKQCSEYTSGEANHKFDNCAKIGKLKTNKKLIKIAEFHELDTNISESATDVPKTAFIPQEAFSDEYDPTTDVQEYGFFKMGNKYWKMVPKSSGGYDYQSFSTFVMNIKFHIADRKNPRRLIELINEHGYSVTVDTPTHNLGSVQKFIDFVEGQGNFSFEGGKPELSKLKRKYFTEEKSCLQIETLGHHDDGFYAFSNGIYNYNEYTFEQLDNDGIISKEKKSYYIPAGNKTFAGQKGVYGNEKKFKHYTEAKLDFKTWAQNYYEVFGPAAAVEICFVCCASFSDIVFEIVEGFPILFLYGEGSSGKGARAKHLMRWFGDPQDALKISEKANTDKAKIREMAQFVNGLVCLEEYTNDIDDKAINTLKGLWDRLGYKRAVMESKFGTESVGISSAIAMTGNEYPINDPLIQRLIALELNNNEFTKEEKDRYNQFNDLVANGVTSVLVEVLRYRNEVEQNFKPNFRRNSDDLSKLLILDDATERMVKNVAALAGIFDTLSKYISFPFDRKELLNQLSQLTKKQCEKRISGAVVQQFWDTVLYLINERKIRWGKEFEINAGILLIRFKDVYPHYCEVLSKQRQYPQKQQTLLDKLKLSDAYKESKDSHRFEDKRTSALAFSYEKTNIDIMPSVNYWEEMDKKRSRSTNTDGNVPPDAGNIPENGEELPF